MKRERVECKVRRTSAGGGQSGSAADLATGSPDLEISWDGVRDVVGLEVAVIFEVLAEVLQRWLRDAVAEQLPDMIGKFGEVVGQGKRDDIGARPRDG